MYCLVPIYFFVSFFFVSDLDSDDNISVKKRKKNPTDFKGVYFNPKTLQYETSWDVNDKTYSCGIYSLFLAKLFFYSLIFCGVLG